MNTLEKIIGQKTQSSKLENFIERMRLTWYLWKNAYDLKTRMNKIKKDLNRQQKEYNRKIAQSLAITFTNTNDVNRSGLMEHNMDGERIHNFHNYARKNWLI